jgi:catechol 2,3-dioxygenase-like lactoylglutathione lyase family enzyme
MKKRTGEPWITAAAYGRMLPPFSVSLIVRDIARSVDFYRTVLAAFVHYSDVDFAAIKVGGVDIMLHADHTYEGHTWAPRLAAGEGRGLGAELRLLGLDPEEVETLARLAGAPIVQPATVKGHGWHEVMVEDPDGYVWAVGVLTNPKEE